MEGLLLFGAQELHVETASSGSVVVSDCGSESPRDPQHPPQSPNPSPPPPPPPDPEWTDPAAPHPCDDYSYVLLNYSWGTTLNWEFNEGTTPAGLGSSAARDAIAQGANSVTLARNSCGMMDNISASDDYLGHTNRRADMRRDVYQDVCLNNDQKSVVDFGDLHVEYLGLNCTWRTGSGSPRQATHSDIRLNKVDYMWTVDPYNPSCSGQWSVRAVAAHEWGHAFGLGHVDETSSGNLTMSPKINGPCQDSEFTLGQGDVLGLRQRY